MATCKRCGLPIGWVHTERGAWMPIDPDGQPHWPRCRAEVERGRERVRDAYARLRDQARQ
jgi:hypothetical protein